MTQHLAWVVNNWTLIAYALGVWALIATFANKIWPKPEAPKWKVYVHTALIDFPAALPSKNLKGIFGLPVNVPFLSVSSVAVKAEDAIAAENARALAEANKAKIGAVQS